MSSPKVSRLRRCYEYLLKPLPGVVFLPTMTLMFLILILEVGPLGKNYPDYPVKSLYGAPPPLHPDFTHPGCQFQRKITGGDPFSGGLFSSPVPPRLKGKACSSLISPKISPTGKERHHPLEFMTPVHAQGTMQWVQVQKTHPQPRSNINVNEEKKNQEKKSDTVPLGLQRAVLPLERAQLTRSSLSPSQHLHINDGS